MRDTEIFFAVVIIAGILGMLFAPTLAMQYIWDLIAGMPEQAWRLGVVYKCLSILFTMCIYAVEYSMAVIIYRIGIKKQSI